MSLQTAITSAVTAAKFAIADLAIPITLRKRTAALYTPGTAVSYTNNDAETKGVITTYSSREIDGDRITVQDLKVVLFNPSSAIPEPNDLIIAANQIYRIVRVQPIYAGSEIVFSVLQVRPSSA